MRADERLVLDPDQLEIGVAEEHEPVERPHARVAPAAGDREAQHPLEGGRGRLQGTDGDDEVVDPGDHARRSTATRPPFITTDRPLEHPDVGERVAVDRDQVGEPARPRASRRGVPAQALGGHDGGGPDRGQRRHAAAHIGVELAPDVGVRIDAAVGRVGDPDAVLDGPAQDLDPVSIVSRSLRIVSSGQPIALPGASAHSPSYRSQP